MEADIVRAFIFMAAAVTGPLGCADLLENGNSNLNPIAWRRPMPGADSLFWHGVPAGADSNFYIPMGNGIGALNAGTGQEAFVGVIWSGKNFGNARLVADAGTVFSMKGRDVYAISAADGHLLWNTSLPTDVTETGIAVDNDHVYVTEWDGGAYALDRHTGMTVWTTKLPSLWGSRIVATGIAVSGDSLYVAGAEIVSPSGHIKSARVSALDRNTGTELWTYRNPSSEDNTAGRSPTVAGRLLLLSDLNSGAFFAIDRFSGREVWRVTGDPSFLGPGQEPAVLGDTAFVGSNDTYVYAVDLGSGKVLWKTRTYGSISAFALCGNWILATNQSVTVIDRHTHRVLGTYVDDGRGDFATSGYAVLGKRAIVVSTRAAYGIECR